MGCVQGRIANMPADEKVPVDVMLMRRDICRQCDHATRNAKRTGLTTLGLTTKSVCQLMKSRKPDKAANIAIGTAMVSASCPLGRWARFPTGQAIRSS